MANNINIAGDEYSEGNIISGVVYQIQSLDGDELQYDTLNAVVNAGSFVQPLLQTSDGAEYQTVDAVSVGVGTVISVMTYDPGLYKYGAEVIYRHDGNLVGKYYMSKLTRVGKMQYKIDCVSPVGLLAGAQHYGGIYLNGIPFGELLTDIIGGTVPFSVALELENQLVYGWLPVATRRDNLHQALFAMGASAQKDDSGDLHIAPLSNETATAIPDNRVFLDGSISYPDVATKVSVSEHAYSVSDADETVTLFEGLVESVGLTTPGGVSTQGSLILFNEPMYDLKVENGEILESGVNYAVLAPAAEAKLTGKKYTHTIRQVKRPETNDGAESGIMVTEATLVSIANSENVADRLMSFYSSAKTITTDIVLEGEKAGAAVQITDPFGDTTKGIIKSLDINMSGTLKARAEIVADYSPAGAGNYYNNIEVIAEDGEWVAPADGKIRVVLIGGGTGGFSGASGADGEDVEDLLSTGTRYGGAGGAGGTAGIGGSGGRIFVTSFKVSAGDTFIVVIGEGGAGGISSGAESVSGSEGADTTFGKYTSANGTKSDTGFAELFGGITYALPGIEGVKGSDGVGYDAENTNGTVVDSITIDGVEYVCGATGEQGYAFWHNDDSGTVGGMALGRGGFGGGPAVGANGGDGADGSAEAYESSNEAVGIGGDGGVGGNASIKGENGAQYGAGGSGGHGGGGGGGGGGGVATQTGTFIIGGSGGAGGSGSAGGQGAQGCVLIYY